MSSPAVRNPQSTVSSISTSAIQSIIERLRMGRLRNTTKNNYYCVWKKFNQFYIKLDVKPYSWEERITLSARYLVDSKKRLQTVKSYISAIRVVLQDDGIELNENKFLLNSLIQTCKFKNNLVRIRMPIKKGVVNSFVETDIENILRCKPAVSWQAVQGPVRHRILWDVQSGGTCHW